MLNLELRQLWKVKGGLACYQQSAPDKGANESNVSLVCFFF